MTLRRETRKILDMAEKQRTLTTLAELHAAHLIDAQAEATLRPVAERYAIAIPPSVHALMDTTDPDDPIAKQFVPHDGETRHLVGELADPIADTPHTPVPGIVHRYPNRALLKIVSVCPVYCRFCFRREMIGPASGGMLDANTLTNALAYIKATPQLEEIIMTGGDPLILSPRRIKDITAQLSAIPHIKKLRWHTRVPVVAPERVSQKLVDALTATNCAVRVAMHANHAREFSAAARVACQRLRNGGVELLSQSVLLRGVNDNVAALEDLFHAYANVGARPYYLHHGDLAPGTARFRTTLGEGMALMEILRQRLPATKVPVYILDVPGGLGKTPVVPGRIRCLAPGVYEIKLKDERWIPYRDVLSAPDPTPAAGEVSQT